MTPNFLLSLNFPLFFNQSTHNHTLISKPMKKKIKMSMNNYVDKTMKILTNSMKLFNRFNWK